MSSVYIFGSSHFCNRDSGEQCDDGLTQRSRSAADQSQLPSAGTANYKDEMGVEGARKAIRCAQIDHCVRLHRTNEHINRSIDSSFAAATNECNDSFALCNRTFHGRRRRPMACSLYFRPWPTQLTNLAFRSCRVDSGNYTRGDLRPTPTLPNPVSRATPLHSLTSSLVSPSLPPPILDAVP